MSLSQKIYGAEAIDVHSAYKDFYAVCERCHAVNLYLSRARQELAMCGRIGGGIKISYNSCHILQFKHRSNGESRPGATT